jgi:hypothetical protein
MLLYLPKNGSLQPGGVVYAPNPALKILRQKNLESKPTLGYIARFYINNNDNNK